MKKLMLYSYTDNLFQVTFDYALCEISVLRLTLSSQTFLSLIFYNLRCI